MAEDKQTTGKTTDSFISLTIGLAIVLLIGAFVYNYIQNRRQATPAQQQEQQASTTPAPEGQVVTPGGSYTVAAGDTLWSIAEKHYKSGYNWVDIAEANKLTDSNQIEVGQTLTIPNVPAKLVSQSATASASIDTTTKPSQYTVVHGDTLWKIAVTYYGSGYRWVDIAKANSLLNPNIIHTGNVLNLP